MLLTELRETTDVEARDKNGADKAWEDKAVNIFL